MLSPFVHTIFFILIRSYFYWFCFLIYNNIYPKYLQNYKKYVCQEIRDFIYKNYYKRIGFSKENIYYLMKHLKKKRIVVACKQIDK